jgi:probable rRNA maturation factor
MSELSISLDIKRRGINKKALSAFAKKAQSLVRLEGSVNVLITGDDRMQALNQRFRRKNKATDVLSFPGAAPGMAGDIAISADIASTNAKLLGHGLQYEIQILLLHGMLHLAGWDHENDAGEMAHKEATLRKKLGLPPGLIARTQGKKVKSTR